jgi:hypothetical protein
MSMVRWIFPSSWGVMRPVGIYQRAMVGLSMGWKQ